MLLDQTMNMLALQHLQSPCGKSEGYNSLFIWGGPGLGKTHLLHANRYEHLKREPKAKVVYMTCEQFTNEFIDAIQNNFDEI